MQILQFKKGENWSNQKLGEAKKKWILKKVRLELGEKINIYEQKFSSNHLVIFA